MQQTLELPVISIEADDPQMQAAVEQARTSWPQFVAAFGNRHGQHFTVKAPINYGDQTEFIWLNVTALEGDQIYGTLSNDPVDLGPLKLGSKVCAALSDLNDWCYVDRQGEMQGGFTLAVLTRNLRRQQDDSAASS